MNSVQKYHTKIEKIRSCNIFNTYRVPVSGFHPEPYILFQSTHYSEIEHICKAWNLYIITDELSESSM